MELKLLDFVYILFLMVGLPFIVGKIVNRVFKIKDNNESFNVWYTGLMSSTFILIGLYFIWAGLGLLFKFIVK